MPVAERINRDDHPTETANLFRAVSHLPSVNIEAARWRGPGAEHIAIARLIKTS
jgi:hypothetical protein